MTGIRSGSRGSGWTPLPRIVRLCSTDGADAATFLRAGAVFADGVWTVSLDEPYDLERLSSWLPRAAGGAAAGEACGHPPDGHAADLERSLCPSSWRILAEVTCLRTGGCVECGDEPGGSASPSWRWDVREDVVHGELLRMRSLCRRCRPCSRPDAESWRWPTSRRHGRIAAIMGIDASDVAASVARHVESIASWDGMPTMLDMSAISGLGLAFRRGWTHEEDILLWKGGSARISGASLTMRRGMVGLA